MSEEKRGKGRPTKYKKEYCKQAEKLCRLGATDKELADFFEVDESTITRWKQSNPEFCTSLKSGKVYSDDKVVDALYNRAIGYELTEVKEEESELNGKKTVVTKRQVMGDTIAQIFWLKNRQPDKWRDKQEIKQETTVHNIMTVPSCDSVEQWEKVAKNQQNEALSRNG